MIDSANNFFSLDTTLSPRPYEAMDLLPMRQMSTAGLVSCGLNTKSHGIQIMLPKLFFHLEQWEGQFFKSWAH